MSPRAWEVTALRLIASRDWWPLADLLTHVDSAALRVLESKKLLDIGIHTYSGWKWFHPSDGRGGVIAPAGSDEWAAVMDPKHREGQFSARVRISTTGRTFLDEAGVAAECTQPAGADRIRTVLSEIQELVEKAISLRPRPPKIDAGQPPRAVPQAVINQLAETRALRDQPISPLFEEALATVAALQRRIDARDVAVTTSLGSLSASLARLSEALDDPEGNDATSAKAEYAASCADLLDAVNHQTGKEPAKQQPAAWSRLTWDGDTAEFYGHSFPRLGDQAVAFLQKLQAAKGQTVKASSMDCRPDRVFESLPDELKQIIDKPERGRTGYRMK